MSLSRAELERFAVDLARRPQLWRHLARHDPSQRVYEQIHSGAEVNAWLICWSDDQDTGFHDHDESAAAIVVISGQVREDRLRLVGEARTRISGVGDTLYVPPTAIHRVLHAGVGPAVTIHAYSPPLTRTGAYRVGSSGELEREAQPYGRELRANPVLA